jgi:hypothetical protein
VGDQRWGGELTNIRHQIGHPGLSAFGLFSSCRGTQCPENVLLMCHLHKYSVLAGSAILHEGAQEAVRSSAIGHNAVVLKLYFGCLIICGVLTGNRIVAMAALSAVLR